MPDETEKPEKKTKGEKIDYKPPKADLGCWMRGKLVQFIESIAIGPRSGVTTATSEEYKIQALTNGMVRLVRKSKVTDVVYVPNSNIRFITPERDVYPDDTAG